MASTGFDVWATAHRIRAEAALVRWTPAGELSSGRLLAAMRYSALGGGKRLRALLAYASAEAIGASAELADHAAAAVEMIHAYSLIHDDMPCMDNDALRRGKPTSHVVFGEATAMLAGDALQPLAFAVLFGSPASASGIVAASHQLAEASGAYGMAGGQAIDLASIGKLLSSPELHAMHRLKTGALLQACVMMGAACGTASTSAQRALRDYGDTLGLAFQVVDDILDVVADSATLGKTAGKDAAQQKPTFVSLMGLHGAQNYAQELLSQARASLKVSELKNTAALSALADMLVNRSS